MIPKGRRLGCDSEVHQVEPRLRVAAAASTATRPDGPRRWSRRRLGPWGASRTLAVDLGLAEPGRVGPGGGVRVGNGPGPHLGAGGAFRVGRPGQASCAVLRRQAGIANGGRRTGGGHGDSRATLGREAERIRCAEARPGGCSGSGAGDAPGQGRRRAHEASIRRSAIGPHPCVGRRGQVGATRTALRVPVFRVSGPGPPSGPLPSAGISP